MKTLLLLLISLGSSTAAGKPPTITQRQLIATTKYWQHVLMLDDWELRTTAVRLKELDPGTAGNSHIISKYRCLLIHVLDPRDYAAADLADHLVPKSPKEIVRDIEDTILHELLHLRLHEFATAEVDLDTAEEVAVARLTSSLLAVKHGR